MWDTSAFETCTVYFGMGGVEIGTGLAFLGLVEADNRAEAYSRGWSGLVSLHAGSQDVVSDATAVLTTVVPGDAPHAFAWHVTGEILAKWRDRFQAEDHLSLELIQTNVRPEETTFLGEDSVRVSLDCDKSVRYDVETTADFVMAGETDFDEGLAFRSRDVSFTRGARLEREFPHAGVEVTAGPPHDGASAATGTLTIADAQGTTHTWDVSSAQYFELGGPPGHYAFALERTHPPGDQDAFFLAAISWWGSVAPPSSA